MTEQAAAPAPAAAPSSPIASLKAYLSAQSAPPAEAPEAETADAAEETTSGIAPTDSPAEVDAEPAEPKSEKPATPKKDAAPEEEETETEDSSEDDAADVIAQLSSLKDLAEATGVDLEKILDLQLPTKIDGKEGTARLRDLQRSYQLDGHFTQKAATLDNDRKTFEGKRAEQEKAAAERIQSLEMGLAILDRALQGDLASVPWQQLQDTNPVEFNSKYVAYQHRFGQMQQIAQQLAAEKQKQQFAFQEKQKAWLEDQAKLLKIKIPEWADDVKRTSERASMVDYLKGHGISAQEFEQVQDHRYLALMRDAWKWAELQKGKAPTLKKLKLAPKILKPGSKQSREARDTLAAKDDVAKLARTGKPRDAKNVLRRQLFGQ